MGLDFFVDVITVNRYVIYLSRLYRSCPSELKEKKIKEDKDGQQLSDL